jgi:hypothetical protein
LSHAGHLGQQSVLANGAIAPSRIPAASPQPVSLVAEPAVRRAIYGHSLVPGGIASPEELMALIHADPQLAEHYKGFDLSKAQIVTLDQDMLAYVSYRLENGIYWTTHPLLIRKGEKVITDGANFIRGACGNRISYVPRMPTNTFDPEDIEFVVAFRPVGPPDPAGIPSADSPQADALLPPLGPFPVQVPPPAPGLTPGGPGLGGGPGVPSVPWIPISQPAPKQTYADEFSTVSLTLLQHSLRVPAELFFLFGGALLVVVLHFLFGRNG